MGLFSNLRKNKQQAAAEPSGHYSSADDQLAGDLARAKRASYTDGAAKPRSRAGRDAADPVLPEKKRARRRLVGAIALAMALAIGLPMLLDTEPKQLAPDIAIQIPSIDKAAGPAAANPMDRVDPHAPLDKGEEIVEDVPETGTPAVRRPAAEAPKAPVLAAPVAALKLQSEVQHPPRAEEQEAARPADTRVARTEPKPEHKPEVKPEIKSESRHAETRVEAKHAEAKPEPRHLETKAESRHAEIRPEPKPEKAERKLAEAQPGRNAEDAARAVAILENKPADAASRYVIQVAALAAQDKVDELQGKLRDAGIHSYTQKVPTPNGERTRIRVGPFANKEEAERVRARLGRLGLNGSLIPG